MNGLDFTNSFWKLCQTEHDELCSQIRAVRESVQSLRTVPQGPVATLVEQLNHLRDHLREHFALEEQGGYMEEALSRAPRFGALASALERQHPLLLREATELAAEAAAADRELIPLLDRIQEFCEALARHEGSETRILQAAFNRDPILGGN